DCMAQAQPQAHRRRDRRGHERQHLSLRNLRPGAPGHQASGAGSGPMSPLGTGGATDRPIVIANVSRRQFMQGVSAMGGLVLAAGFSSAASAADPPKYGRDGMPNGWSDDPLVFVAIGEDGTVSIVCHRSEMGQGVRTGMPMIVADELEADWKRFSSPVACTTRTRSASA